jgi:uncharacterized protein YbbC (DUF1343 family)
MKTAARQTAAVLLVVLAILAPVVRGEARVRIGAEVLLAKRLDLLRGKKVGLICNHTARLPGGAYLLDTLLRSGIQVVALFAPEHGIRGVQPAGETVSTTTDPVSGLPVYSLYGGTRKPTQSQLEKLDVLVFDMQDAGARFYTYASTMAYCMEAAAENGKKFILLDRPNPINGVDIEGPVLDLRLISFIGLFPIPIRHGLTLGELARMVVGEGYINPSTVDLTVIPMEGWKRSMWYDQTGLPWIPPSPSMKTLRTATVYPGSCFVEATNISEGRGTPKPFEYIGAPGLPSDRLAATLNDAKLPGVRFQPVEFRPVADSGAGSALKFKGKRCTGVFLHVTDRTRFRPVLTGLLLLQTLKNLAPNKFILRQGYLDHLTGDESIGQKLMGGTLGKSALEPFRTQLEQYRDLRKKYLIY